MTPLAHTQTAGRTQREIELVVEYRTVMVTAVTGKIDIRSSV